MLLKQELITKQQWNIMVTLILLFVNWDCVCSLYSLQTSSICSIDITIFDNLLSLLYCGFGQTKINILKWKQYLLLTNHQNASSLILNPTEYNCNFELPRYGERVADVSWDAVNSWQTFLLHTVVLCYQEANTLKNLFFCYEFWTTSRTKKITYEKWFFSKTLIVCAKRNMSLLKNFDIWVFSFFDRIGSYEKIKYSGLSQMVT